MAIEKEQYTNILRNYDRIQEKNRLEMSNRYQEVLKEIPQYKELEDSLTNLHMNRLRQTLSPENAVSEGDYQASLDRLVRQKKQLLISHGFEENYLEPIYSCPDCMDTGFIQTANATKTKCHCFTDQEINLLYQQSNIREIISQENFSTIKYEYYKGNDLEKFKRAVEVCKSFTQNFKKQQQNIFLYGSVGTGKSFLSGCIAYELLQKKYSVIYFSSSTLFDTLAKYSFEEKSKESLYNFHKDLYNCDLVIIDDLGTELTNVFVSTQLFSLINERHLRQKATVISSNLSLPEIRELYSDRVFSRITCNYSLCKLNGDDIRIIKKRALNTVNI